MLNKILFFTLIFSQQIFAAYVPDQISNLSLKEVALNTLKYSIDTQIQDDQHPYYYRGEFPTKIESSLVPAIAGVGKIIGRDDDEATAFTTASVINILSQVYLKHPELHHHPVFKKIPDSISQGVKTFDRYKDGSSYNFYPSLVIENNIKVHRPINMTLLPIWHGFTNVPNDSDTTSAVLTAQIFHQKISKKQIETHQSALNEIDTFLDTDRSAMFYNKKENRENTGAFMTWLYDEADPKMPRFYFASSEKGARIPFNKNDVDCVVNANILKLLAISGSKLKGHSKSCEMINDMIQKDERATCGVYYPNTYNLSFSLASAQDAGDQCLSKESKKLLIEKIIEEQNADGSWKNIKNVWSDEILSTAFAMYSLLEFGDVQDPRITQSLVYGTHYLIIQAKMKNEAIHWKEDNFFTATALARSLIMWKSKAYTNSIIASVFLKMHSLFPQFTVNNYKLLKMEN